MLLDAPFDEFLAQHDHDAHFFVCLHHDESWMVY